MTPKELLRSCWECRGISRPLIVPLAFSYTAKLQQIDLKSFYTNPTILTNALYNAWKFFRYDGIVNYVDDTLELEALGCKLDWQGERYKVTAKTSELENLNCRKFKEKGRIPNAIESIRRLNLVVQDECVIAGILTGPFTLLNCLFEDKTTNELMRKIADAELEVCRAYLESGADLVIAIERSLPSNEENIEEYAKNFVPFRNTANFFEAPFILFIKNVEKPENLHILKDSVDGIILNADQQFPNQLETPLGYALTNSLLLDEKQTVNFLHRKIADEMKPFLLTTNEEVHDIPAERFRLSINALKNLQLNHMTSENKF